MTSPPPWPADLDPLVAAPAHQWPAAHYVLSWSPFVRRDAEGTVLVDTRAAGAAPNPTAALWGDPLGPHSLENVGSTPLHVISVEVKPD